MTFQPSESNSYYNVSEEYRERERVVNVHVHVHYLICTSQKANPIPDVAPVTMAQLGREPS